jgi:hypothetical protein
VHQRLSRAAPDKGQREGGKKLNNQKEIAHPRLPYSKETNPQFLSHHGWIFRGTESMTKSHRYLLVQRMAKMIIYLSCDQIHKEMRRLLKDEMMLEGTNSDMTRIEVLNKSIRTIKSAIEMNNGEIKI